MTQLKPTFGKTVTDAAALAAALGVDASALATTRAPAQEVNSGSTFFIVPMASRQAVDAAVIDRGKLNALFAAAGMQNRGVYVFSTERAADGADAYTRLVGSGGIEDPATGSAAGPAGCFMVRYGFVPAASARHLVLQQGVLVKRPSRLHVAVTTAGSTPPLDVSGVKVRHRRRRIRHLQSVTADRFRRHAALEGGDERPAARDRIADGGQRQ
jgi:PhzF family phenazine biosynthesis protein